MNSRNSAKKAKKLMLTESIAAESNPSAATIFKYPKSRSVLAVTSFITTRNTSRWTLAARSEPDTNS